MLGASLIISSRVNLRLSENSILITKSRCAAESGAELFVNKLLSGNITIDSIGEGEENESVFIPSSGSLYTLDESSGQYFRVSAYKITEGDRVIIYVNSTGYVYKNGKKLAEKRIQYIVERISTLPPYYDYAFFAGQDLEVYGSSDIILPEGQKMHTNQNFRKTGSGDISDGVIITYSGSYQVCGSGSTPTPTKVESIPLPNPLVDTDYWRNYIKSGFDSGKAGYYYIPGDIRINGGSHGPGYITIEDGTIFNIPVNPEGKTYVFVDGDIQISSHIYWSLGGSPELVIVSSGRIKVTGSVSFTLSDGSLTLMSGDTSHGVDFHGTGEFRIGGRFNILSNADIDITGSKSIYVGKQISFIAAGRIKKTGSGDIELRKWQEAGGGYGESEYSFRVIGVLAR